MGYNYYSHDMSIKSLCVLIIFAQLVFKSHVQRAIFVKQSNLEYVFTEPWAGSVGP